MVGPTTNFSMILPKYAVLPVASFLHLLLCIKCFLFPILGIEIDLIVDVYSGIYKITDLI